MRIKSIQLAWFRGAAAPVSLEPNCKSMVVYGENGSGKSSFVDAVEYVLKGGSIEHLRTEYSGTHQVYAVLNTHKPEKENTELQIKFQDDSELNMVVDPKGPSKSSGAEDIAIGSWEYRQTILRQNEVSDFIHDTKGRKYSALLPLFGLHDMEVAAENLRKLAKHLKTESGIKEKQTNLTQIENQRIQTFGTQSYEQIVEAVDNLFGEYCLDGSSSNDEVSRSQELEIAINNRINGYSADNRRHVLLKGVTELKLRSHVDSVRSSSVKLAGSLEPHISETLAVLQATGALLDGLGDKEQLECPACGQMIGVDAFREHVKTESDRLKDINDMFTDYRTATGTLCDTLNSLKANLCKPDLKTWRDGREDAASVDGFKFLEGIDCNRLREACSEDDLKDIESKLLPIIEAAAFDSKDAPPDVQKLMADMKLLNVAISVFAAKDIKATRESDDALIALIELLEQEVRYEIRRRSQNIIDGISADIESMWATLHPGETIDNIRLVLPPDADKAIDVALKFHGLEQESPRLTLSEGYRNSLGLCIFLAMAKRVTDIDRPLFLDDVVVSFDRHHRGMIQELLEKEFCGRQVLIFTHDREWYTELRHQLDGSNRWSFKTLFPYETPDIGIRWSHRTTTFDDARALIEERPDAAGHDARRIMDVELSMIAERLQIRLPYLRSDKNDRRMAHDFLVRLVADGKKCFQKKTGSEYVVNTDAIEACDKADKLLTSWGNRASHTFDMIKVEAVKLIDACEGAIACFKCYSCDPPSNVWRLDDRQSEYVQCRCGEIRWRYGRA